MGGLLRVCFCVLAQVTKFTFLWPNLSYLVPRLIFFISVPMYVFICLSVYYLVVFFFALFINYGSMHSDYASWVFFSILCFVNIKTPSCETPKSYLDI